LIFFTLCLSHNVVNEERKKKKREKKQNQSFIQQKRSESISGVGTVHEMAVVTMTTRIYVLI
jgi:hypothetical protein